MTDDKQTFTFLDLDAYAEDFRVLKLDGKEYKIGRIKTRTMFAVEEIKAEIAKLGEEDGTTARIKKSLEMVALLIKQDNPDFDEEQLQDLPIEDLYRVITWTFDTVSTEKGFLEKGHGATPAAKGKGKKKKKPSDTSV